MSESLPEIYLARHGGTAWTISHQHTGRPDIPLTERGERGAQALGERLRGVTFYHRSDQQSSRARRTAELAGFERSRRGRGGPHGMGLRSLRRSDDGRNSQAESGLDALPRRLPGRRDCRRGGGTRRSCASPPAATARAAFSSSVTATSSAVLAARWLGTPSPTTVDSFT